MLIWLSGIYNSKWELNENYGRELMELFTLGVSDPRPATRTRRTTCASRPAR